MGSNLTKFKKIIEKKRDETEAINFYMNNTSFRNKISVNASINDEDDTLMNLVCKHGMTQLLKLFITEKVGNLFTHNKHNQNLLHSTCLGLKDIEQYDCLQFLINTKVDVNAKDATNNTPLHYAALNNHVKCVSLLIESGACLFTENKDNLTPCDLAAKFGHVDLALLLESKMLFNNNIELDHDEIILIEQENINAVNNALRVQDIQEEKDKLIIDTSEMLHCSLINAEILLRKNLWSQEEIIQKWIENADSCFEECGIPLKNDKSENISLKNHIDFECDICLCVLDSHENVIYLPCDHKFCKNCLKEYLTLKINEENVNEIMCAGHNCYLFIEHSIIEDSVSPQTARKYLQFGIKSFVDSYPLIKWCPNPQCGLAAKNPFLSNESTKSHSRSIECTCGNYYCWSCLQDAHEPVACDQWSKWFEKIQQMQPNSRGVSTREQEEAAANNLWLVVNSKKCPQCKTSIEKNEGCNHVKCIKCKYDFCWVCMESWKKHSGVTGGHFQCNRFEIIEQLTQQERTHKEQLRVEYKNLVEYNRFAHYYTRFKNHETSYSIEKPLLESLKMKFNLHNLAMDTNFLENALKELLKARQILRSSYVFGYYLNDKPAKKLIFEFVQNEYESKCELLSQIVARPYLKTPISIIIKETRQLRQSRFEFMDVISADLSKTINMSIFSDENFDKILKISLVESLKVSKGLLSSVIDSDNDDYDDENDGLRYTLAISNNYEYDHDLDTAIRLSLQIN